jgi:fluoride exporter
MGLLFVLILERTNGVGPQLRSLLLIGLLGGYTTFSSFSIETLNLFESGAWISAALNIFISVALCLALTWLGILGGRQL